MIRPLERIADLLRVADIRSAAELLDLPGQLLNSHKLLPLLVGVDGIAQIPHHPPQLVAIHARPLRHPSSSVTGTPQGLGEFHHRLRSAASGAAARRPLAKVPMNARRSTTKSPLGRIV